MNNFLEEQIYYEIYIKDEFNTVFDLSYTLIDLQAIINGFSHIRYLEEFDTSYGIVADKGSFLIAERDNELRDYKIISDVSKKYPHIDEGLLKELIEEIESSRRESIDYTKVANRHVSYYQTTSRTFLKKHKNNLKLRSFKSGSLILEITSSVLSGLIFEFVKKIIFKETNNNQILNINFSNNIININKDNIIINDNNSLKKCISISDRISDKYAGIDAKKYIDTIMCKMDIVPFDYEKNVKDFLNLLASEGIVKRTIIYNEKGVKTMSRDIERLAGRFVNISV